MRWGASVDFYSSRVKEAKILGLKNSYEFLHQLITPLVIYLHFVIFLVRKYLSNIITIPLALWVQEVDYKEKLEMENLRNTQTSEI